MIIYSSVSVVAKFYMWCCQIGSQVSLTILFEIDMQEYWIYANVCKKILFVV